MQKNGTKGPGGCRTFREAGEISHSISQCYRCKTVIEPLPALQWYVSVQPLAAEAIKAVRQGETKIIPKSWENTYFAWMEDI